MELDSKARDFVGTKNIFNLLFYWF